MRTEDEIRADAAAERPFSNGTEFDIWADRWCWRCVHDNAEAERYCPILTVALQKGWPGEWTRERVPFTSVEGEATFYERVETCTEFDERRGDGGDDSPEPEPVPECGGQLDIIDAYLPVALEELTPRAVPV